MVYRMWFKAFYIFYLFCTIFLTSRLGSGVVTPRQGMCVVMLVLCLVKDRQIYNDKYWRLYWIFILFFGMSSFVTGYFEDYLLRLAGDFVVAFVACWATKILIERYDSGERVIVYFFVAAGCVDAFLTIGQVLGWGGATAIPMMLNLDVYEDYYRYMDMNADMMNYAIPGLFRSAVDNGHFLCVCVVLSIYLFKRMRVIVAAPITMFLLCGSFMAQQRAGFYLAVVLGAYLLFKCYSNESGGIRFVYFGMVAIALLVGYNVVVNVIANTDSRVAQFGMNLTGRDVIWSQVLDYLGNHLLFGGFFECVREVRYPHNVVLSAFLSGGLVGGCVLVAMMVRQLVDVWRCLSANRYADFVIVVFAIGFVAMVGDSFMHNISVTNGDVITWIVWTAFYYSCVKEKNGEGISLLI